MINKFVRSVGLALSGITYAIKTQSHMRMHLFIATCVMIVSGIVSLEPLEWAVILLCIGMVICAELVNTAIEQTVDLASPTQHPIAKRAKDIAAGAVLASAVCSAVVGILIFVPYLW